MDALLKFLKNIYSDNVFLVQATSFLLNKHDHAFSGLPALSGVYTLFDYLCYFEAANT